MSAADDGPLAHAWSSQNSMGKRQMLQEMKTIMERLEEDSSNARRDQLFADYHYIAEGYLRDKEGNALCVNARPKRSNGMQS